MVALLAIAAAFFYGLVTIFQTVGLRYSNPLSALLISQVSSLAAALVICFFTVSADQFASRAVVYFVASGAIAPFIAQFLLVVGINRVGGSIASALYQVRPLFSALGAVIILGEGLTASIGLGMLLMVFGTAAISFEQSGGKIDKEWSRKDLIFPIMSGACFGIGHVFKKIGLNITPIPIIGATVQTAAALAFFSVFALAPRKKQMVNLRDKRAWLALGLAGFSSVAAMLCFFSALNLGQVVVVVPLSSCGPLFVLLLVRLFLKKVERVTWKIVLGAVLIIGGAVVLALLSPR